MKKLSRILALVLALCLALSLGAFASGDAAEETAGGLTQVDETHWAGDSITIESIEYAEEYRDYVDATLFNNISKIVYDGGEIDVDYTKYTAILTVDTVQVDLYNAAGQSYTGDVVITLVEKAASTNQGNSKFGDDAGSLIGPFYYIAAAYFDEDGYQEKSSVVEAQDPACVIEGNTVSDMYYMSVGDYMTGVYVDGGEVSIKDSTFVALGRGGDDFSGQGISVVAKNEAKVDIDGCTFVSEGALRSGIWAGGSSEMNVSNTFVQTYNDPDLTAYSTEDNYATPMMQQVPFALGLTGNVRATLDAGMANISFTDCLVASDGWAVLSTDSGSGSLVATDTIAVVGYAGPADSNADSDYDETAVINGVEYLIYYGRTGEQSGYCAFCDGFTDYAYGGRWFAPDYLFIITGGSVTIGASEKSRFYGSAGRIGFMNNGTRPATALTISEADFDVTDTFVMIKSKGGGGETISLSDVTVNLNGENPWSGDILSLIDSDDLGGGPGATTYAIPYGTYDEYLAAESGGEGGATTLAIADSELTGNIYNSIGSQTGSQTAFKNDYIDVTLTDTTLTGAVSSAYSVHTDAEGKVLTGTFVVDSYGREGTYDYLTIGRLVNYAAPTVNNPVSLTLTNSTWNVAGLSYLAALTVDEGSTVNGDVYQDGVKVELKAGTYENVVVVPAGADYDALVADTVAAIAADAAAGIVPMDRSDLVASTSSASGEASDDASASAESGEASATAESGEAS